MNASETAIRQRLQDYNKSLKINKVLPVPDSTAVTQLLADVASLCQVLDALRGESGATAARQPRSIKITQEGFIQVTGLDDTMFTEGQQIDENTWLFDGTRLLLLVKCLDTNEVFTKVNAWDEVSREALVGDEPRNLDRSDSDFPFRRVHNCVANLSIVNRETGKQRTLWEDFKVAPVE